MNPAIKWTPGSIIGSLATLVRLHEGNRDAEVNELLEQATKLVADIVESDDPARQLIEAGHVTRATIAELIAADEEYDAAQRALEDEEHDETTAAFFHAHRRFEAAYRRRRDALLACKAVTP